MTKYHLPVFNDVLEVIDETLAAHIERNQHVFKSSCKEGCDACCHQLLVIDSIEGLEIAFELLAQRKDLTALKGRLHRQAHEFQNVHGRDRTVYYKARVPCVFLQDHRCTMYERRPAGCRTYVVGSPAELCDPALNPSGKVAILDADRWTNYIYDSNMKAAPGIGIPYFIATLPEMLLALLDLLVRNDSREAQRLHDRFRDGKAVISDVNTPPQFVTRRVKNRL